MTTTIYAIALGANIRGRHGRPEATLKAAIAALGEGVLAISPIIATPPMGPSSRRFANAAVLLASDETPPALLARLKALERGFGRRRGRRWGARALDLDIILWSGGRWTSPTLIVPHVAYRGRAFVLRPLASIAPGWRDRMTGRSVRQLAHMVDRRAPCP